MKIAVDGGAFQQGIAGGIYNVAVGLLNAMAQLAPRMSFVFVIDPRFGPARPELLRALDFEPELVEAHVGYDLRAGAITTIDPHVVFEIDGRLVEAEVENDIFRYKGAAPRRAARIHSRLEQPSASGSLDTRYLGLGIREIRVVSDKSTATVAWDDPRLRVGFHSHDPHLRWTSGPACLPQELFDPDDAGEVLIEIVAPGRLNYRFHALPGGGTSDGVARAAQAVEVALLEQRLVALGCTAYLANHFIPISLRRLTNYAILYDVVPVKFPEYFLGDARRNFEEVMRVFRRAHHSFGISEASRKDLLEVSDIDPDRVTTAYIDIDPLFRRSSQPAVVDVKRRYGLDTKPYILCVGTIEPRKNHHKLLHAFLASRARSTHALVVVGKRGWGVEAFFSEFETARKTTDVRVLDDVPTEHLPMLYSGAAFLAYPSLYEGFGLPIVEAMACGCPVLTSNLSSMAEIAEGAAVLVDPKRTSDITAGIDRLASNLELQAELRAKGKDRRSQFSWAKSAAKVIAVLGA